MPRNDPALDLSVGRVSAPASVAHVLVESDGGTLGIAEIEIEDRQAELPREALDLAHNPAAQSATARPGRDKGAGQGSGEGLRFIVARRPAQLRRAGNDAVEPADDEPALGDEQHALPIILEHLPRRRLQPAKPATLGNGALGGLAEIVEIRAGKLGQPIDRDCSGSSHVAHGRQRKKFPINRSPDSWLFSGWNWVPATLFRPTTAVNGPPYSVVAMRSAASWRRKW